MCVAHGTCALYKELIFMKEIEAKAYGPDCTPEEIGLLKGLITIFDSHTLLFKEAPIVSEFQIEICFNHMAHLIEKNPDLKYLLIDLSASQRPGPKERQCLKVFWKKIAPDLDHISLFTEKNFLLNTAAKFVLNGLALRSFSIHKKKEEAIRELKKKKMKAA
jgi:hypothetical protein